MILVEKVIGSLNDPIQKERYKSSKPEFLHLESSESQKNRIRKSTDKGLEVAISLSRELRIHDNDILYFEPESERLVIAKVRYPEVMVLDFFGTNELSEEDLLKIGFQLGHALGNQHWPSIIKGKKVYVPLAVNRKVMLSAMHTHKFEHITIDFQSGEEVSRLLSTRELRLLFGGSGSHSHTPENSVKTG